MFWRKNNWFCCPKHDWKSPDILFKTIQSVGLEQARRLIVGWCLRVVSPNCLATLIPPSWLLEETLHQRLVSTKHKVQLNVFSSAGLSLWDYQRHWDSSSGGQ